MHRKRTRFAARVDRVAAAIERRGVVATVRSCTTGALEPAARGRRYDSSPPVLDDDSAGVLERLREEGYAVLPFAELIPDPRSGRSSRPTAAASSPRPRPRSQRRRGRRVGLRRREGKEFVIRKYSYGVELGLDDPWLRLGVNRRLLDVANAYLGMWSKLEYVDLWYTPPARRRANALLAALAPRLQRPPSAQGVHLPRRRRQRGRPVRVRAAKRSRRRTRSSVAVATAGRQLSARGRADPKVADRAVTFTAPKGTVISLQHVRLPPRRVRDRQAARARDADLLLAGIARVADGAELRATGAELSTGRSTPSSASRSARSGIVFAADHAGRRRAARPRPHGRDRHSDHVSRVGPRTPRPLRRDPPLRRCGCRSHRRGVGGRLQNGASAHPIGVARRARAPAGVLRADEGG